MSDIPIYKYERTTNMKHRMMTYKSKSVDNLDIEYIIAVEVYIEDMIKQYSIHKHEQHRYINQIELIKTNDIQKYINLVKYLSKLHYVKINRSSIDGQN